MTESDKKTINVHHLQTLDIRALQQQEKVPDSVISEHMPMIQSVVSALSRKSALPTGIEREDMISWGIEGLIKAYKSFNADKGSKFSTYAFFRIRGEIYDNVRKEWSYRNPSSYRAYRKQIQDRIAELVEDALQSGEDLDAHHLEESLANVISTSSMSCLLSLDSIEDWDNSAEIASPTSETTFEKSPVWEEVEKLSDEEQTIIDLFYVKGLKQKEIATRLKYSTSKVCRIHLKTLNKLKSRLEKTKE